LSTRRLQVRVSVSIQIIVYIFKSALFHLGYLLVLGIYVSSDLSLEGVVLLGEVLLPEMVGVVSTSVAPFEDLLLGYVDVLEVLALVVAPVSTWSWNGKSSPWRKKC